MELVISQARPNYEVVSTHRYADPDETTGCLVLRNTDHKNWWRAVLQADKQTPPRWTHQQADDLPDRYAARGMLVAMIRDARLQAGLPW